jgi:hypothetical protein
MQTRRRLELGRRWFELRQIRFSIADQEAKLDQARNSGVEHSEIGGIEANLKWLKQALQQMSRPARTDT